MIIKAILIMVSIAILLYFLSNPGSIKIRAYKKIFMLIFILGMIVFIANPNVLNVLAKYVGVGRGADLLLYIFFVSFIFLSINIYIKFKSQQDLIFRLARQIALLEANKKNKN